MTSTPNSIEKYVYIDEWFFYCKNCNNKLISFINELTSKHECGYCNVIYQEFIDFESKINIKHGKFKFIIEYKTNISDICIQQIDNSIRILYNNFKDELNIKLKNNNILSKNQLNNILKKITKINNIK